MLSQSTAQDAFDAHSVFQTIGASLIHIGDGEADIALDYRPDLCQQDGFIHAGILTTIVDSACGLAALTMMPEGARVLTVEFKINFMSPGIGDRFIARGRVIKSGRTISTTKGEVYALKADEDEPAEKLISVMQATMFCIQPSS